MSALRVVFAIFLLLGLAGWFSGELGVLVGPLEYQGALGFQYTEGENPIITVAFNFDDDITTKIIVVSTPAGWSLESQDGALTFSGTLNPGGTISIPISFHTYVKPGTKQVTSTGTTTTGEVSQAVGPLVVLNMTLLQLLHTLNTNLTPLLALTALTGITEAYLTYRPKTPTTPPPPTYKPHKQQDPLKTPKPPINRGQGVVTQDIPTPNGTPTNDPPINKGPGTITPEIPTPPHDKLDPGEYKPHKQEDPLKGDPKPEGEKTLTPEDLENLRDQLDKDGPTGDPGPVVIEPGHALDSDGTLINIPEDTPINLEEQQKEPRDPKYDTYLRYDEDPQDPVAPYTTEDHDHPSTDHTRIREDYRFELRTDDKTPADPKLQEQVEKTLKELQEKKKPVEE